MAAGISGERGSRPTASGGRRRALALLVLGGLMVALGPRARVSDPEVSLPELPSDLDRWLEEREGAVHGLLPEEAKGITWRDGPGRRTPMAVVYLHGFSADRHEIDPVPARVAEALGANLFHTRLTGHGTSPTGMGEATARDWLEDAAEAVAVGSAIGDRVILMGTSTGGTLALWAASQPWGERLEAIVLLSPNLGINDPLEGVILWPWGNLLVRLVLGPERCFEPANEGQARHWTTCYPSRAILPMMALVDHVRRLPLGSVRVPALVLQSPHDQVVSPARGRAAFDALGSSRKRWVELGESGDPSNHIPAGDLMSPETTPQVVRAILDFLRGDDPPRG